MLLHLPWAMGIPPFLNLRAEAKPLGWLAGWPAGYGTGAAAPGRCSDRSRCKQGNTTTEPGICARNLLLAHALVRPAHCQPIALPDGPGCWLAGLLACLLAVYK